MKILFKIATITCCTFFLITTPQSATREQRLLEQSFDQQLAITQQQCYWLRPDYRLSDGSTSGETLETLRATISNPFHLTSAPQELWTAQMWNYQYLKCLIAQHIMYKIVNAPIPPEEDRLRDTRIIMQRLYGDIPADRHAAASTDSFRWFTGTGISQAIDVWAAVPGNVDQFLKQILIPAVQSHTPLAVKIVNESLQAQVQNTIATELNPSIGSLRLADQDYQPGLAIDIHRPRSLQISQQAARRTQHNALAFIKYVDGVVTATTTLLPNTSFYYAAAETAWDEFTSRPGIDLPKDFYQGDDDDIRSMREGYMTRIISKIFTQIKDRSNSHVQFNLDPSEAGAIKREAITAFGELLTRMEQNQYPSKESIIQALIAPVQELTKNQYGSILLSYLRANRLGILRDYLHTAFPFEVHCASTIGVTHDIYSKKMTILEDTRPNKAERIQQLIIDSMITVPNIFFSNIANILFTNAMYAKYESSHNTRRLTFPQIVALGPIAVARSIDNSDEIADAIIAALNIGLRNKIVTIQNGFTQYPDDIVVATGLYTFNRIVTPWSTTDQDMMIKNESLTSSEPTKHIYVKLNSGRMGSAIDSIGIDDQDFHTFNIEGSTWTTLQENIGNFLNMRNNTPQTYVPFATAFKLWARQRLEEYKEMGAHMP
jgi:hypothetical protein